MLMKIGELAKKTGCKVVTIRFYEQKGLLKKAHRTSSNYRLYDEDDLARLNLIMHCRNLNLSLNQIKKLLICDQEHQENCEWVGKLIEEHILEIDKQIQSLKNLKSILQNLRLKCTDDHIMADCGIIQHLHKQAI